MFTLQGITAVTALGDGSLLANVNVCKLATGCLDDLDLVGGGVVGEAATISQALHHEWRYK